MLSRAAARASARRSDGGRLGDRPGGVIVRHPRCLAGVPWLVDDNLIQNFPLRVLVGIDLRHGHAPVWDPYLWSGSPLLSGFNAGAAYPATWLFSILPGAFAWVANQALVEVVAALGMVVLLRVLGRSWTASGLGALAFSYGGFMVAQNVHIDVVAAGAWLPWAFAALDRLAHRAEGRSATPWVAMLGLAIGMMGLSGAAEPILDGGIVLALYALWLLWRSPGRRWSFLGTVAARGRARVGPGRGAARARGRSIQEQSQRAAHSYWYFTSGSMNKSLTVLGLDPLLLGTSGAFPLTLLRHLQPDRGVELRRHHAAHGRGGAAGPALAPARRGPAVVDLVRRARARARRHVGWVHATGPRLLPHPAVQPPAPAGPEPPRGRPGHRRAVRDLARPHGPVARLAAGRSEPTDGAEDGGRGPRRAGRAPAPMPGGGDGCRGRGVALRRRAPPHPARAGDRPAGGAPHRRHVAAAFPARAGQGDPVLAVAAGGAS